MQELRANTQVIAHIGPFPDVGDGLTPQTDIAISGTNEAELLKHGASTVVDISAATWGAIASCRGWYNLTLTTSHTDTEGMLEVIVQDDSDCLPVHVRFMVLSEAAWDFKYVAKDAGFPNVNIKTIGRADAQETEANNLESACSNYSATRGLTGTALPAAAANAAGGVPVSAAGGLALDTQLANTNEVTAARMAALTDWINGGRLDLLLDAIPTTAMRGTDSAAQASVCTEARLQTLTDWIDGGRLDLLLDAIATPANVATALADIHLDHLFAATYDPASKPGAADALLNEIVENDGGVSRFTTNALEQAPSGSGGDATAANQATILSRIGTPANIDEGGASISENLKKICDDNGGADFDATTDSLAQGGAGLTAAQVVTALMADTSFTAGGTLTFQKLQRLQAAWIAGNWQPKSGVPGTSQILDADDSATVVAEATPNGSTGVLEMTIL